MTTRAGTPSGDNRPGEAVRALARASRLLESASGELSLAHYRVLSAIASGDQRASRIATKLAVGKPTISATVEALCRRGLLVRSAVHDDQRVAVLGLTPEGDAVLARVESAMIAQVVDLCSRTPDRELSMQSLVWLGVAIDEVRSERPQGSEQPQESERPEGGVQ